MKRRIWLPLVIVGMALTLFALAPRTHAWMQFRSGDNSTVAAGQTVDSTLWIGAHNVDIAGTVNGDVICGAQTVNISGTVRGDVICGAQTITITGTVEGNVRLGAQTVNLNGSVGRNASVAAQTINMDSKSRIGSDASFAGSDLNLNGSIGRDLAVAGSNMTLSGEVARDIQSRADKVSLLSGAKVGGGIDYTSKNKINMASGAHVGGKITYHQAKEASRPLIGLLFFTGVMALIAGLVLLFTALAITALLPRFVHSVSNQAIKRPWLTLLTGFAASIVVPILVVILMITIIGIPLGILLLISWLLVAFTSGVFSAYYVGRRLWTSQTNPLLRVLLGGWILLVLFLLPFVGFFVMFVAFWMGAGMIVLELKRRLPRPKYQIK